MKTLYVGAAGVIWALDALRRSGHAETSLDLDGAAVRALELQRAEPDVAEGETHYHPAALLQGETGPLLVAFVGSYLGKIALSKLEEKNFRRVVLVLVFLIGLTTLGKFVEQISR